MKHILQKLFNYQTLSKQEAEMVLTQIAKGAYNESEITAFMTVYLMRSITLEELEGFRAALLSMAILLDTDGIPTIDIVGTGGDGKNTFNISTLACFIVAGAGKKITKHGNYAASSITGSSNVMEALGYQLKNDKEKLLTELDKANICFLHAPFFHPALKIVAPIRKNLAIRTFFNMLGPLVNPALPAYQIIGVYNLELARIYAYLLQPLEKPFTIIHSLDGYDEISLTNDTKVITQAGDFIYSPAYLGKRSVQPSDIEGGKTAAENKTIFLNILEGKGSFAQNAVVLANAAIALYNTAAYQNYEAAYQAAVESLDSGKALKALQTLISLQ